MNLQAEGVSDEDILMGLLAITVGTMSAELGHGAAAAGLHQVARQLERSSVSIEGAGHC